MSRYALVGGGRRTTFYPGTSGPSLYNASTAPSDSIGNDGEFTIDTNDWTIWGPKGATTPGSWAGTKTALKNFKVPQVFWNFTGANPNVDQPPSATAGKPGDLYFVGPSSANQALGTGKLSIWVNTGATYSGTATDAVNNWFRVYFVDAGSSASAGGDSGGGAGGGDGGD